MSTVRWSPTTAIMMNDAPGTIVCGAPGSGKTFALLNFAANCIGLGQRVVVIDPKNDFNKLLNVNNNITIIDINHIHPGALNPFEFLKKINEDGEVEFVDTSTIITIIELLCGKLDKDIMISIVPIVTDFVTKATMSGEYVDMLAVAEYLFSKDDKNAQAVGTMLKMYTDNQYGPLLFTKETDVEPLHFSSEDSMIITLHGLSMPDYSKSIADYDANERFTAAILYIITLKLSEVLFVDNKVPTTFICDEAHILYSNKQMGTVIDKFLSLGRSLNVATVLASQGISRFPENIANYVTTKFLFKSSMDEAANFLDRFDTSKINPANAINTNAIIAAATNFPTGTCFMIDRLNRNGIINIKSIYDVKLLTSNPLDKDRQSHISEED